MKKVAILSLALTVCLCIAAGAFHWLTPADVYAAKMRTHERIKDAIKKQVDDIVVAIDGGKTAMDFKKAATNKPHYVFIMEEDGNLLVHPLLIGQSPKGKHETYNLKEKAQPVFTECVKATANGLWVHYLWKNEQKRTYVRKTKSGLIVGSGFNEK